MKKKTPTSPRRVACGDLALPRAPKTPPLALPRKRGREAGEGIGEKGLRDKGNKGA